MAAVFGGDRRGGLERRVTTAETHARLRHGLCKRVPVRDECGEMLAGFVDRRGPDHFAPVGRAFFAHRTPAESET